MKGRYARRAHLACGCEWGGGRAAKYCPMGLRLREGLKVAREQSCSVCPADAQVIYCYRLFGSLMKTPTCKAHADGVESFMRRGRIEYVREVLDAAVVAQS